MHVVCKNIGIFIYIGGIRKEEKRRGDRQDWMTGWGQKVGQKVGKMGLVAKGKEGPVDRLQRI